MPAMESKSLRDSLKIWRDSRLRFGRRWKAHAPPVNPSPADAETPGGAFTSLATRNFLWQISEKVLAAGVGVLVFGLIARQYGPDVSGHYAYAMTLMQTALGMSLVCSAGALLPRVARMRLGVAAMLANVFVVRLVGSTIATGLVAIYIASSESGMRLAVTLIALASVPFMEPFYVATMYWQSRNQNRAPVLNRSCGLAVRATLVVAAVAMNARPWVPAIAWFIEALIVARLHLLSLKELVAGRRIAARVSAWRIRRYSAYGARFLIGVLLGTLFMRADRLVLARLLDPHEYGLYATAMQLVEAWLQVAQVIGTSIGPTYLYAALRRHQTLRAHIPVIAGLALTGGVGLALAVMFGEQVIDLLFGARFERSYPFLVAGTAYGVLAFVDLFVVAYIAVARRPVLLTIKSATSLVTVLCALYLLFPDLQAQAGPASLAIGLLCGWLALIPFVRTGEP